MSSDIKSFNIYSVYDNYISKILGGRNYEASPFSNFGGTVPHSRLSLRLWCHYMCIVFALFTCKCNRSAWLML